MDYLLPDEQTISKMADEYKKLLQGKENDTKIMSVAPTESTNILVLYFIFALGYNLGYGTAISDTNGSVGRVQSKKRSP